MDKEAAVGQTKAHEYVSAFDFFSFMTRIDNGNLGDLNRPGPIYF